MGSNKKVLSKAVSELGKAKAPAKPRDIIVDPAGQWKYPGQETRIPGNDITMQGVPYPVWAQPNVGPGSMMQPNQDYNFPGASYVDETPMVKKGGTLQSKKYSKSMSATNKLFTKNKLFQNKKSKIFDPNAEFKTGGSKLGTINLNPNPLSHYELNYGFNLPTEENGGESDYEDLELTDEEIQAYRDGGYVVEELPKQEIGGYVQHELVKAQGGKTVYSGPNRGLVGPSTPKTNGAPTIANAKILEAERQKAAIAKQQAIAKQKENELLKRMPKVLPSETNRATATPARTAVEDVIESRYQSTPEYKAHAKAVKEAEAKFKKEQWEKYKKMSTMDKVVDRTQAALSQPLLMASNALMGEQAYLPGMHDAMLDPSNPNYQKYRNALGANSLINDGFNMINPGNWGAHAGQEYQKGNYIQGAGELVLGLAGLKGATAANSLVKGSAKALNKVESNLSKFIPERVPGTPRTGGGNLNAGISPELIKNFVGPKNKVLANIVDKAYISPFFSKTINKYNPLNLFGIGEKLEGAVSPLSNVLGNSIKNNKLIGSKSLFGKAKPLSTQVGKTDASQIYAARFNPAAEGSNIRLGEANPQGRFSRKSNATFPIKTKAGVDRYDVPISDPGVELFRKYPFMNRYAPINKQKLMNNQFQWSTTGAGLQNTAEKFGKTAALMGTAGAAYGAANLYNPNDPSGGTLMDNVKLGANALTPTASEFISNPDPYFIKTINNALAPYTGLPTILEEKQKGGDVESWEDDLDDEEIMLLEKGGYIVERL